MRRTLSVIAILILVVPVAAWPGLAEEIPPDRAKLIFGREWIAGSTTAMGVTGAVRLRRKAITFENGVVSRLRYLSEVSPTGIDKHKILGGVKTFSLFEFVETKPRLLRSRSTLCGNWLRPPSEAPAPRYLAVGLEGIRNDELLLIVFSSAAVPDLLQEEGLCGT